MLTYKRKLKLSNDQVDRISSWIGTCRLVYNMGMEIKKETWKNKQINVSGFDLMKQLTEIKDTEWIADVPSQSLQNSLERLDRSYKNFFRSFKTGGGFPKFKSKRTYNSILFKQGNFKRKNQFIELKSKNKIKLPKIGELSFFKDKCHIIGKIKTATIVKEPTGFFICIVCDEVVKNISNTNESQVIGIDMGVANFCVDSNGNFIKNPKHFKVYEDKLRIENRSLSRKKKFSNRWKKQAKKLGLLHHKIANVRKDFLHKESTIMAKKYHTVYLEDLNIKNMSKNKNLSKHILDCGWGMFRTMLEYKTNVFRVNPKYTSQTCNECGTKDAKNRLTQSEFVCKNCGHISHADINAAKNILSKGVALNRKREALACALVEEPRFL
jgi:putative transposase